MNLLYDSYTALLSGLTHKTGNEIHWRDKYGHSITIEPIDISQCKYIVRWYYENGNKEWETEYQNDKLHGKEIGWNKNGKKYWEDEWQNGNLHGKTIWWDENGNKACEAEYQNGKRHWHKQASIALTKRAKAEKKGSL